MKSVITVMSIVLQTGTTTAVGNREIRYYCNVDCFAGWNYSCGGNREIRYYCNVDRFADWNNYSCGES